MLSEHRAGLLEILARLDQLETGAREILCEPVYADIYVRSENVREELVELRANVEEYLDAAHQS
jgi:hypothetical protein